MLGTKRPHVPIVGAAGPKLGEEFLGRSERVGSLKKALEPGDRAQPTGHGCSATTLALKLAAEALDVGVAHTEQMRAPLLEQPSKLAQATSTDHRGSGDAGRLARELTSKSRPGPAPIGWDAQET